MASSFSQKLVNNSGKKFDVVTRVTYIDDSLSSLTQASCAVATPSIEAQGR